MKKCFLTALLVLLLIIACAEQNTPEQVVRDYYTAMDNEDIELYMSTVSGPRADVAGEHLAKFFADYDISYTVDTLALLSKVGNEAQVLCVVTAMDEGGPKKFTSNRISVLNMIRKNGGRWTVYDAEVSKPIKLDEQGNPIGEPAKKDSLLWKLTLPAS